MRDEAGRLEIDTARMAGASDSVGGNLGAVMALRARDTSEVPLHGAAIIYPGTGLDQDRPSYLEHADAPGLTRDYRDLYLPHDRETHDPYARPIMATTSSASAPSGCIPPKSTRSAPTNAISSPRWRVMAAM